MFLAECFGQASPMNDYILADDIRPYPKYLLFII